MDDETLHQVQERFAAVAMLMEDLSARLLTTTPTAQEARGSLDLLKGVLGNIDQHAQEIVQILTMENDEGAKI